MKFFGNMCIIMSILVSITILTYMDVQAELESTQNQLESAQQVIEECIDYIDTQEGVGSFMDTVGSGDSYDTYLHLNQ